MAKKKFEVSVNYIYTIEVDTEDNVVKEYNNDRELIEDLASYEFKVLPVLERGVYVNDVEMADFTYEEID